MKSLLLGICFSLTLGTLAIAAAPTAADTAESVSSARENLDKQSDAKKKFYARDKLVREYASGPLAPELYADAKSQAEQLLKDAAGMKDNWNYGNAVHHGNLTLGRLRLAAGDLTGAEGFLLKAADVSSSQLISFGPNMRLALELLLKGRRAAVLQYFDRVQKFWNNPKLAVWRKQIQAGKKPSFGANLGY